MSVGAHRGFSLPDEPARYVESLVESGRYATDSDALVAGLQALRERDAALEDWLRDEVLPVAAAMRVDLSREIPIDRVFEEIRAVHDGRVNSPDRVP